MKHTFRNLSSPADETGQTMAEFGVLVAGIALVVALVVPIFGTAVGDLFRSVVSAFGSGS
jgi:Flp pilus assembly pilin Flp